MEYYQIHAADAAQACKLAQPHLQEGVATGLMKEENMSTKKKKKKGEKDEIRLNGQGVRMKYDQGSPAGKSITVDQANGKTR